MATITLGDQARKGFSSTLRRRLRRFSLLSLAIIVVLGPVLFALERVYSSNEGVVIPGELYRSGQLDGPALEAEIRLLRVKSVLNLRGANAGTPWYVEEVAICRRLGVRHADVRISAKHLPSPGQAAALLELFHVLPRPILMHCNSGSDRTGLASTIYLIDQKSLSPGEASRALTWQFGHFAVYPYFEMNEFVELYGEENPHRRTFDQWVLQDYPRVYTEEGKETTLDEMMEPFESLFRIPYWVHRSSSPQPPLPGSPARARLTPDPNRHPILT